MYGGSAPTVHTTISPQVDLYLITHEMCKSKLEGVTLEQ